MVIIATTTIVNDIKDLTANTCLKYFADLEK